VTHDQVLVDCDTEFKQFVETMDLLGDKLGPLLLQFGYFNNKAFVGINDFLARLKPFLKKLPKETLCLLSKTISRAGRIRAPQSRRVSVRNYTDVLIRIELSQRYYYSAIQTIGPASPQTIKTCFIVKSRDRKGASDQTFIFRTANEVWRKWSGYSIYSAGTASLARC
jgi:hypothetical protein